MHCQLLPDGSHSYRRWRALLTCLLLLGVFCACAGAHLPDSFRRGFHTTTWVSVEGRFYPGFLLHLRIRPSTIDITYGQVVSQRPYGRWIDCLPNRTWRPRQGGPNGQKPALYPVSGLIPVRTCHGPKCPPAQPPSGASGPLAAAILKRGLERPRRRAGSPTWGRARAGGRPLGCVARGRLRWGRRDGCWGGRQTGINLSTRHPAC